uniref:Lens fiber membrane intrinsic protein-like n=1 Tax=Geotrypetes seraphini TaxID=260995 RepID=A0A6P8P5F5_GEOSA|nr:lens fiber membrane intrinsic protein-like [Geotrypetes seraphini]XP_033770676.1 lens fiber membrane intrinsic protein-like [Geotrypetes seraphini]XP_033770677.1 lens fiber membrane intrinsic protein-like [Geotrypetes seraphini]
MSIWSLPGFILTALSTLFVLVILASPNWINIHEGYLGLWVFCNTRGCASVADIGYGGYFAVRAFILIAFFFWVAALILLAMALWYNTALPSINKMKHAANLGISAAVLTFLGMAIFTGTFSSASYGWAFGLGWFAALLSIAAAVVVMIDFKTEPQSLS